MIIDTVFSIDTVCNKDTAILRNYTNCDSSLFEWNDIVSPTGKVWMDRNLGASRAATNVRDSDAYGDLFQWGRLADGHQCRSSSLTSAKSINNIPGHSSFISNSGNWLKEQNDSLWNGVNGINNPCPSGYRVPTEQEWEEEIETWTSKNVTGGFSSVLKLPASGFRYPSDGYLGDVNHYSNYWSSTVSNEKAIRLYVVSDASGTIGSNRVDGYSIRCIKDY